LVEGSAANVKWGRVLMSWSVVRVASGCLGHEAHSVTLAPYYQ